MPSSSGTWSIIPVASSTRRARTAPARKSPRGPVTASTCWSRNVTFGYFAICARASRRKSAGAMPSRLTKLFMLTRRRVAPRPAVRHQHALARAPEREGGLEPGRPAASNQHVEDFVGHRRM